ncbi:phosphoesterase RecJ domain-containing protein [Clostridium sp. USBA 49]|uniref:DHH family phosphoesterase n=1 Tax=Clostridium TaxID=1485 RepID=UPI0009C88525|nr:MULTISPECIES: bifunctional oligoribonuclease/PAP phosphatase NrnA [Clostridium]SKA76502.1 phosphoesterase RecJ domain-containing protein [Clostridium sp. USBA 49]
MLNEIINKIKCSENIGITFHISPDGDSLGSALALMIGLKKINKNVYIICNDNIPDIYDFLPYIKELSVDSYKINNIDCIIVLDCGNFSRISANLDLNNKEYTLINIDHHISNEKYGDLNYISPTSAAVGEIIYELLKLLYVPVDKDMATCLYTSIISDTGGFKHSNTTSTTHKIAGELIDIGIDHSEIYRMLFENVKFERVKLYGKVIDAMYLSKDKNICIMKLTKEMLDEIGIEASDTSDIISIGVNIDTVEVTVLLKETDKGTKVSLRSKSIVDVRKIAEYFGGGGHIRASGILINKPLKETENLIIKAIEKELI